MKRSLFVGERRDLARSLEATDDDAERRRVSLQFGRMASPPTFRDLSPVNVDLV